MKRLNGHRATLALLLTASVTAGLSHAQEQSVEPHFNYLKQGLDIALLAKNELSGQLKQAMSRGGPTAAVKFCNENALPITRSVSIEAGARVSRVSDRPRNPANAANASELAYIVKAKSLLASGEPVKPSLQEIDGRKVGFYPIVTSGACLLCHGDENSQISPATLSVIDALYPEDQATGYGLEELRGIFVVSMEEEK